MSPDRAQSEVIGVILILSISMVSIGMIYAYGKPSLETMRSNAQMERIVNEFTLLDSEISAVALGGSQTRSLRMNTGDSLVRVDGDEGWVNITHEPVGASNQHLYNETIGEITYRSGPNTIAYQGGGVWRKHEHGDAVMLSPPEFRFRGATLTFPIFNITSSGAFGGPATSQTLSVERQGDVRAIYPNESHSPVYENPIKNGTIVVTVHSKYYTGWADYFRERTAGEVVDEDPAKQTTTVELSVENSKGFENGLLASGGASSGKLDIENNNGMVDSYNSSEGPYSTSQKYDGSIRAASTVKIDAPNAVVHGDIYADGDIEVRKGKLNGSGFASGSATNTGGTVTNGALNSNQEVNIPSPVPADDVITSKIEDHKNPSDNDNSGTCISNNQTSGACTLGSSSGDQVYYLENPTGSTVQITDDVDFDLADGNVSIVVNDNLEIRNGPTIRTINVGSGDPYHADWYLNGRLEVRGGSTLIKTDASDTSWRMNFNLHSGNEVELRNQNDLIGTIYAPGSELILEQKRRVYGAIIVDKSQDMGQRTEIHFDEALLNKELPISQSPVAITYLHVTENKVEID